MYVHRGDFRRRQCDKNGTVCRDGKWYCKKHDPVAAEQAKAEKVEKWEARCAEHNEIIRRRAAEISACSSLPTAALEAGVVGMMREALELVAEDAETPCGLPWTKVIAKVNAVLALLKEEKP
jgi:hypothetical protein